MPADKNRQRRPHRDPRPAKSAKVPHPRGKAKGHNAPYLPRK